MFLGRTNGHIWADFDGLIFPTYEQKAVFQNGTQITHSLPRSKQAAVLSPENNSSQLPIKKTRQDRVSEQRDKIVSEYQYSAIED